MLLIRLIIDVQLDTFVHMCTLPTLCFGLLEVCVLIVIYWSTFSKICNDTVIAVEFVVITE
jgi:hypothetical protein